jgi:alpha-galactosidase
MVGLCHSVQGLAAHLAEWIDVPADEVVWDAGGINHQAWLLRFEHKGEDLYPRLRKAVERPEIWEKDIVRNEMFKALGYYVTESSGHNSEYNWWFRKRPDLIEKYCTHGKDWNPGVHAFILKHYSEAADTWRENLAQYAEGKVEIKLGRSHEYASAIVLGLLENKTFKFYGNIPNTNLITNLPQDSVVEVPIIADKTGYNGIHVGALPPQLVALNHVTVMVSELTVQAALEGDPVAAYQACCYDPVAASKLSLAEIKEMVDELFQAQAPLLPQFKYLK